MTGANSLGYSCYAGCTPNTLTIYNNIFDVAGRIGYLEGSLAGGHNIYWRGDMWNLPMLSGDKFTNPHFRNARLGLKANSPAVDKVKKARMKKDLGGRTVGVDGNGDGRRAADIGAREAKAKGRRHGSKQGPQGQAQAHGPQPQEAPQRPRHPPRARKGTTDTTTDPQTSPGTPRGRGSRARVGRGFPPTQSPIPVTARGVTGIGDCGRTIAAVAGRAVA